MARRDDPDVQRQQERIQRILKKDLEKESNRFCADCGAKGPRWASWNIGCFICTNCAGHHRNLGVHISKVKSVNLDKWTEEQLETFQAQGGNDGVNSYYEARLPSHFRRPNANNASDLEQFIRAKYERKEYVERGGRGGRDDDDDDSYRRSSRTGGGRSRESERSRDSERRRSPSPSPPRVASRGSRYDDPPRRTDYSSSSRSAASNDSGRSTFTKDSHDEYGLSRDSGRDYREKDSGRDSRDKDYGRDSRDKEYGRGSRDKDYGRTSRDSKDSRDKDYGRSSGRDDRDRYGSKPSSRYSDDEPSPRPARSTRDRRRDEDEDDGYEAPRIQGPGGRSGAGRQSTKASVTVPLPGESGRSTSSRGGASTAGDDLLGIDAPAAAPAPPRQNDFDAFTADFSSMNMQDGNQAAAAAQQAQAAAQAQQSARADILSLYGPSTPMPGMGMAMPGMQGMPGMSGMGLPPLGMPMQMPMGGLPPLGMPMQGMPGMGAQPMMMPGMGAMPGMQMPGMAGMQMPGMGAMPQAGAGMPGFGMPMAAQGQQPQTQKPGQLAQKQPAQNLQWTL